MKAHWPAKVERSMEGTRKGRCPLSGVFLRSAYHSSSVKSPIKSNGLFRLLSRMMQSQINPAHTGQAQERPDINVIEISCESGIDSAELVDRSRCGLATIGSSIKPLFVAGSRSHKQLSPQVNDIGHDLQFLCADCNTQFQDGL